LKIFVVSILFLFHAASLLAHETELSLPHYPECYGGGVTFLSRYYSFSHTYPDFKEREKCREGIQYKEAGEIFDKARTDFATLLKLTENKLDQLEKEKYTVCSDLRPIIKDLNMAMKDVDDYVTEFRDQMIADVHKKGKDLNLQQEASYQGFISALCGSGHSSIANQPPWEFIGRLMTRLLYGPELILAHNEATFDQCRNLRVDGKSGVRNLTIDLKKVSGPVILRYQTYTYPDRFQATLDGKIIFQTKCQQMTTERSVILKVSAPSDKKLAISIENNCEGAPDPTGNKFLVILNCGLEHKNLSGPCDSLIYPLIDSAKNFLESSRAMLDSYWMQVLCYEKVYGIVFDKFKDANKYNSILQLGLATEAIEAPLFIPPVTPKIQIESTSTKVEESNTSGPEIINLKRSVFAESIGFYCSTKPSEKESLLKHVSWAYCYHGFKRLPVLLD